MFKSPRAPPATTIIHSRNMWSPSLKQVAEHHVYLNSRTREVCVVGAMGATPQMHALSGVRAAAHGVGPLREGRGVSRRPPEERMWSHAAKCMPLVVIAPPTTAQALSSRAAMSPGATWLLYPSWSVGVNDVTRPPRANSRAESSSAPGNG